MPKLTTKKPVRMPGHGVPLKEVLADARLAWREARNLAPRVGRPAVEQVRILDVLDDDLLPVVQRLVRWRARHPERQFRPISQYRLIQFVRRRVGPTVDASTIKTVVKKFRLKARLRKSSDTMKALSVYTLQELTWLAKHSPKAQKARWRAVIAESLENVALVIETADAALAKHPYATGRGHDEVRRIRSEYVARAREHGRLLALFSPPLRPHPAPHSTTEST